MERRRKQEELLRAIKGRSASYEIQTVMDLLKLQLETTKNNLLTCSRDDFLKLQGEAQAYDKLIRSITRPSLSANQIEE